MPRDLLQQVIRYELPPVSEKLGMGTGVRSGIILEGELA